MFVCVYFNQFYWHMITVASFESSAEINENTTGSRIEEFI